MTLYQFNAGWDGKKIFSYQERESERAMEDHFFQLSRTNAAGTTL